MSKGYRFLAFAVRSKFFYPLMRFLGALGIALIIVRIPMHFMEGALYDLRMRMSPSSSISGKVITIAVDEKTLATLGGEPDTQDQSTLISQLKSENPLAIVNLSNPSKWVGSQESKNNYSQKASGMMNLFFATEQVSPMSQFLKLPKPFDNLLLGSAPVTRDNVSFAGDRVTRRALIAFDGQLVLQPILANLYNKIVDPNQYRGSFESDGSIFNYIPFHPAGTYKPWSFMDVRDGRFPEGTFTDKIVIIGIDTKQNTDDYILTPHSRHPLAMSQLEAQANIIDTLIQNNGIVKAPEIIDIILTVLVAYLTVVILWSARPLGGIAMLLAQTGVFCVLAFTLFAVFGLWVNMIHPLIAIFVSYYFFIPYRLIVENKKGWELYQRNQLLTQVEELKSNFISMMSHDLKTPIARIQGMAELALTDKKDLSHQQKDALSTIMRSSEELGNFITSILDLSRIESEEVKLHKSSKDINNLLKEVIKKYDYHAKQKNITIIPQLDPLFSIKVDIDLMRQVFSNIVENAIKYSPNDSTVTIKSREEDGRIKVSVTDSGPGISEDDVDNIFLKFYRSKAAKASPIKGSGLGLYLAKYFIELHDGKIAVESTPAKGTTFTVDLPVNS